jgi:hypothetical protein
MTLCILQRYNIDDFFKIAGIYIIRGIFPIQC